MAKRARHSFAFATGDGNVVVSEDDLYADDHPYVRAYPGNFVDPADDVVVERPVRARPVEQATAAPGEFRRGPGRPRKEL